MRMHFDLVKVVYYLLLNTNILEKKSYIDRYTNGYQRNFMIFKYFLALIIPFLRFIKIRNYLSKIFIENY